MDNQPTAAIPNPQPPAPVSTPPKIKHAHKFIFGYLALIVLVAAVAGVYTWQHKKVNTLNAEIKTLKSEQTVIAGQSKTSQPSLSTNPRSFYDCLDAGGTTSKVLPLTCMVFGNIYTFPSQFNIFQVDNLRQVPAGAIPLITSIGQTNFKQCSGNLLQLVPSAYITLAQSNFVDVGVGCDSGHHEYLGLNGSKWTDLGGGQAGITCAMVTQYKINLSSLVTNEGSAGYSSCSNPDGSSGTIPTN